MLTAALCIEDKSPYSIQVVFSEQGPDDDSVTRANVSSILNDPRFDRISLQYDFAILTLSEEVTYTPSCLPANIGQTYAGQVVNVHERWRGINVNVNITATTNEDCLDAFEDDEESTQIAR